MTDRLQDNGGAESVSHPATADLAAVLAAVDADDSADFVLGRFDRYIALARAVVAERAAHAAILASIDDRIIPHDELYDAADAASDAVTAALAALAGGSEG